MASHAAIHIHRQLHVEDGLVQSQVNAVFESSDGTLWFGTFGGVSRWDGTRFENYRARDGLSGVDVRAFHETADGDILIATADNGMCRFRAGEFTVISAEQGLPSTSTRGFHLAADGRLHVATGNGLFSFADETLDLATVRHELPGVRISGIARRQAGGFYLSTFSHGVLVYRDGETSPLLPATELPGSIIRAVHEHDDGSVLISVYHRGVWVWRQGELTPFAHNEQLSGHDVMSFVPGQGGTLYLTTAGSGVGIWRGTEFERLTTANGLGDDISWAGYAGSGNTIYFGTWDGVSIYHPGRTLTLNADTGLGGSITTAIAELADGTLAIASIEGGIGLFDGRRVIRNLGAVDGLAHDRVWSLLAARDGSLYIGTHAGLNRWRDGILTTVFREPDAPHGRVYSMLESENGELWLGTYGGIRVLRDGRPEAIYDEPDTKRTSVHAALESRAGELYFGTAGGLITVKDGRVELPAEDSPLARLHIWSIHESADGTIYLGTNGDGLWIAREGLANAGPFEVFTTADGLSANTIFSIAEGEDGRIFLGTQRGVSILSFEEGKPSVRQFHSTDGLAGEECNQGGSCFRDSRGRLWFGTIRGVTCYDPARDLPVTRPPSLRWRDVRLFDEVLPLADFAIPPVFGHRENFFRFDFTAALPRAPHQVLYRHRLTGIDPDWVEGVETSIAYTSLPAASYRFEVMARNEWGYWSSPIGLAFRITPPFWRTWWFLLMMILALVGATALIVAGRMRQLLAYEQLRAKIAADLHDDIGAGLSEISIISRLLESKLPADQRERVRGDLDQLSITSRQLVRSMSDIVWLVNPQRDSLRDVIARLQDSYQSVCASADIQFLVENLEPDTDLRLGMERRQHLFLLFKEAINNALKHSRCGELSLVARAYVGRLSVSLSDDGVGFDTATPTEGNGLRNMRVRAEKLGGSLLIESAPGEGCRLTYRSG